jgi:hypothetical protein
MRMRETWLALSHSKKTILFSSASAPIALPPRQAIYDDLVLLKVGSRNAPETGDVWFAVSEESMVPDPLPPGSSAHRGPR